MNSDEGLKEANEEPQSMNEELTTLNAQVQDKVHDVNLSTDVDTVLSTPTATS